MTNARGTPYILPFAVFIAFLVLRPHASMPAAAYCALWIVSLAALIWRYSRRVIRWRPAAPAASAAVGAVVFLLWIAPDMLWPGYREHWLFQNVFTGTLASSLSPAARADTLVLALRSLRAVLIVPVVEELFWRGWLLRWVERSDFEAVPLGHWSARAFVIVALLFAAEHGPYWDVGLIAGAVYNGWVVRTKSLADCILAHAVTNACLCVYVIAAGRWQYWL